MARTIDEIKQQLTDTMVTYMATAGVTIDPTTWSATNLIRLTIYVFAFCAWVLETLFDLHTAETEATLAAKNPATRSWYRDKCLNFQYGFPLQFESDEFDNTGYTEQQIEDSKVIKYAAIIRRVNSFGRILLIAKVAGVTGDDIEQLDAPTVAALNYYFNDEKVAPAGDNFVAQSGPADKIKMKWLIKYNPLVINSTGSRVDGSSSTPVVDAIKEFLTQVYKFGGTYVPTFHIDYVQAVPGVIEPQILECSTKFGGFPFAPVNGEYVPDSGYLKFYEDADLEIIYEVSDI